MYEALRRFLRNPCDAPVILEISKWRITITTTSNMSLKKKHREVDPAVFKNICDWSKRIHEPVFEIFRGYHFVHINFSSLSVIVESVRSFRRSRVDNQVLGKFFQRSSCSGMNEDIVPESAEFVSCIHAGVL